MPRLPGSLLRLGMGTRLLLAFGLLIVLLLAFSAWSFRRARDERRTVALRETTQAARTVSALVHGLLHDLDSTSLAMSATLGRQSGPLDQDSTGSYLTTLKDEFPRIRTIFITNPAGAVIASSGNEGVGRDIGSRPYIQAVRGGQDFVLSDAVAGLDTQRPTVTLARAVRGLGGELRGILVVAFYPDQLTDLLPGALPEDATITVFDRSGALVLSDSGSPPAGTESGGFLGWIERIVVAPLERIERLVAPSGGDSRIATLVPVPEYGWSVGASRTLAAVEAPVQHYHRRQLLAVGLLVAIASVLALVLSRALAQPLVRLAEQARAFGRGERTIVLPSRGPAEVHTLALALKQMAGEVEARFAEREAAEGALRESEQRLHRVFDTATAGIHLFDRDGRYVMGNAAAARIVGLPEGYWDGVRYDHAPYRRLTLDGRPFPLEEHPVAQVQRTGQSVEDIEFGIERPDGTLVIVSVNAAPLTDADGTFAGVVAVFTDITERTRADEALRESEERFRSASDAAGALVYEAELQEPFAATVHGLRRVTGFAPDTPLTSDWWHARIHPDDLPGHLEELERLVAAGDHDRVQYRFQHADGGWIHVEDSRQVIRADDGTPLRLVGAVVDITARTRAEAERERLLAQEQAARVEAEAANRAKDEFLSVLSHELRTPLTPIIGFTEMLRRRKQVSPETLARALETIDRSAKAQARLVSDLLDVSRIVTGKLELENQPVDLALVIEAAVDTVRPEANARSITLVTEFDPSAAAISGDPDRLQQVLWNLLANAIKFTPEHGQVAVRLSREGHEARVTVSDTGKGIAPDFLPYVFDRFRQADASSTRIYGGLGLGLAIVRHLVELHGGRVAADSAGLNQGTTFTVWLPLAHVSSEASETNGTLTAEDGGPQALDGVRVLIVEDDPDTRTLLRLLLEGEGATVTATEGAGEAFTALESSPPDVLLADIGMPGEDGYSLIARVRSLPPEQGGAVNAIALTAYASADDRRRALAAGFQRHLAKPVEPAALVAAISSLYRWPRASRIE